MKYKLGQTIFYMLDNKVHSAPVLSRLQVDYTHENWASTAEQKGLFQQFIGDNDVKETDDQ